jgi:hypothetical protein
MSMTDYEMRRVEERIEKRIDSLYRELSEIHATQWKMTAILVAFMIVQTSWIMIEIS